MNKVFDEQMRVYLFTKGEITEIEEEAERAGKAP